MYYKYINNRIVLSQCKTIQTNEGAWISNPSVEQIHDAGGLEYTPPAVQPQPQTEPEYGDVLEAVKKMLSTTTEELSDADALAVAALFPTWNSKIGNEVSVGDRLGYDDKLYKVVQAHTVSDQWLPNEAVSLYTEVSIEEFPEWRQPVGSQDAYMSGDKVRHNDKHWESIVDNNTWEPGVYGGSEL